MTGSGFNKTLSVISTEDWTWELLTVDLGDGTARGVALSPTGDRVAVGVMDGFVRVFEVKTGTLLDIIPLGKAAALHWLDDSRIAAGTRDGLWTVLTLSLDDLQQLAREQLAREFTPNECALYRIDSCPTPGG